MSQPQLAAALGYTANTVQKWEQGINPVPPVVRLALEQLKEQAGMATAFDIKARRALIWQMYADLTAARYDNETDDDILRQYQRRAGNDGITLYWPGSMGSTVRAEGLHLTEEMVRDAWEAACTLAAVRPSDTSAWSQAQRSAGV